MKCFHRTGDGFCNEDRISHYDAPARPATAGSAETDDLARVLSRIEHGNYYASSDELHALFAEVQRLKAEVAAMQARAFNAEDEARLVRATQPDDPPSEGNEGIVAGLQRLVLAFDHRGERTDEQRYFDALGLRTRAAQAAGIIVSLREQLAQREKGEA